MEEVTNKNINSCFFCSKKIGITETITNKCKCKNIFCNIHKAPNNHSCNFNYLSANKDLLTCKLPEIKKSKIVTF